MENFRLTFDGKKLNAFVSVRKSENDVKVTPEIILNYLEQVGVIYGVNDEAVRKMIESEVIDKRVIVATGKEPVKGEDGRVKFHFKTDLEMIPKVQTDGSVDFHDLQLSQNVKAGEIIAERTLFTEGKPGISVLGDPLPAIPGTAALLMADENTEFQDEEQLVLIAKVDGNVKLRSGNRVVVNTVFHVKDDVDFSTGNLDVTGDVYVAGNVISGFKIKASGNVIINGLVEDARIDSEGDVMVRRGFVGTGKGIINAEGNVMLKFINNQTVNAGSDIHIGEEAVQAQLNAGKSINMTRGRGILVGGEAHAGILIEVNVIGTEQKTRTLVLVAEHARLPSEIETTSDEIAELRKKLDEVMQRTLHIIELSKKTEMTVSQKRLHRSLEEKIKFLDDRIEKLMLQKTSMVSETKKITENAFIRVKRKIYPGTKVKIAWMDKEIKTSLGSTEFRMGSDKLLITEIKTRL
ncbi:DUF342 domain-containing protein [bacterium]|nr:DUF342 domain-containing protein [bacterium]